MARPTKDRHTAIERLAELLPGIRPKRLKGGKSYHIRIEGDTLPPVAKSAIHVLAFMAQEARYREIGQDAVVEAVRWTGSIPLRGLSSWQERALTWLQG